jgi:uncharacterized membrane-anchored protein YitT (DUF2179 family)
LVFFQGAVSFVNIPLALLAVQVFDGNFFWSNMIYLLGTLPCIGLAWMMGQGIKKEAAAKKKLDEATADQGATATQ